MKKFLALTLIVCLCLGLGVTALATTPEEAADMPIINGRPDDWPEYEVDPNDPYAIMPLSGNPLGMPIILPDSFPTPEFDPNDPYAIMLLSGPVSRSFMGDITVDGEPVNLLGIPGAPNGYVPMRVIAETVGGVADYYPDENTAFFYLDSVSFSVNFTDLSVEVNYEPVADVKAYLDPTGYTFLPASLLNGQGQITVDDHPEMDSIHFEIKTSASDPMVKLVNEIAEACEMSSIGPMPVEFLESMGFDMDNYVQLVAHAPMMNIKSNTIFIAQVAEGKMDAAKENFKAAQDQKISSFENYLIDQYELAQAGEIVVSPDGAHLMLVISEHNDTAIELFNAAFPAAD